MHKNMTNVMRKTLQIARVKKVENSYDVGTKKGMEAG